jgi:Xaa-Pro aminopeptidase
MLTKDGCLARRRRLWQSIRPDVEWLLIADPRHVHYLSNFWIHPLSFSAGERGLLLLERDGRTTLLGDNFSLRSAAGEPYIDDEVVEKWYDHKHSVGNRDHALQACVKAVSPRLNGRLGAIESEWLPIAAAELLAGNCESNVAKESDATNGSGAVGLGTQLRRLRRQKEPDEIELLRQCMRAGEAGHARAREVLCEGVTEFEVFLEVQAAALKAAGRPGLLYGDFRGVNAGKPKAGGLPTDYRLKQGDLFIIDYSVVLEGYRGDFTNTLSVGKPSDEQSMLFELCQAALQKGADALKAGTLAKDVYNAVSAPLIASGYGALPHHAGHGIGLGHPEPPILVPDSDETLLPGDVVTLEPGLYIEGIGGMRIENNYLITETGTEQMTNHLISLT